MDMKKILENMDAASTGKSPVKVAEVGSMKAILESMKSVTECGMSEMPYSPESDPVTMNVTLNARGADAIADLIKLMGGQGATTSMPVASPSVPAIPSQDSDMDSMKKFISISSDDKEPIMGTDNDVEEEWTNSPEEEYKDHQSMTKDLSGGINRQKKMHKPAAKGDNPMAVETSIKDRLWAALTEKKTTEGRGRGKKAKDMKTAEGRGKLMAGRGRGKKK